MGTAGRAERGMARVLTIFILSVDRDSLLGEISIWKRGVEVKGKTPQPEPPRQLQKKKGLQILSSDF
jgi:hypothetical protein